MLDDEVTVPVNGIEPGSVVASALGDWVCVE